MTPTLRDMTAVVTCHDSGPLLERALDSIRRQGPVRIVLVDDGSDQCSCHDLAPHYSDLLHVQRPNGGQPAALNTGVENVVTEVVAFLDDDDEWVDGKAERQLQLLSSTHADVVVGGVFNVLVEDQVEVERAWFPVTRVLGAITARTDAVRRVGGFSEATRHHSIVEWWLRATDLGLAIADDDDPALIRRIHGGNSGIVHRDQARRDLLKHLHDHAVRRQRP